MKIDNGTYATLPKGSKITIPNPKWDGDKPKTHFYIELAVSEDACIEFRGQI